MKGEDIDKIFRDALGGQKAPTTEHDWVAFEAMMDAQKGGWSKWTVLMVLLILILGGTAAYYALDKPEAQHISKAQNTKTLLEQNRSSHDNASQPLVPVSETGSLESDRYNAADTGQTRVKNYLEPGSSDEGPGKEGHKLSQKQQTAASPQAGSIDLAETTGESKHTELASRYTYKPAPSDNKAEGASADGLAQSFSAVDAVLLPEKGNLPEGDESKRTAPSSLESNAALSEMPFSSFETESNHLESMTSRAIEMGMTLSPVFNGEKRKLEIQQRQRFGKFIYFELEQNNVLRTSSAIGLGLERNFRLAGKGAISVQGAMGYQRTGRLNWEQSSQTVTYGFDRYVAESNLRTDNLQMIQLPLRIAYLIGVHRVFAGAQVNWVVNGAQEFRQVAEGHVEKGYLFDSGAPNPALFLQLGYGYALNERMQLDLGFSTAGTRWEPANNRPMGGFIRLNYFVR